MSATGTYVALLVISLLGPVMEIDTKSISPAERLSDLGMDSLMSMQLSQSIQAHTGAELSAAALLNSRIEDVAAYVLTQLLGVPGASEVSD
ncbi:acyl carrier protein [Streptomyces sp. NPDC096339]|uniref:acyl carrier protein n=1 Tax=Streptomyces sp. NPDC096339 TaxID=3366086 RepID=UPI00381F7336